jgi:hypothetical protein
MPTTVNRISWILVRIAFAVLALLVLALFNLFVNVSAQNLAVSILWTVLIATAVCVAYLKFVKGNTYAYLFGVVVLVVASFVLIAATGASASPSSTTAPATVGDTGGVNWDKLTYGLGCANAQVWHTGNYPVGGFTNYHAGVRIRYCTGHDAFARIDAHGFSVSPYVEDTQFVDDRPNYVTQVKTTLTSCFTANKVTWHGCLYVYVRFSIPVDMPLKGDLKTATPWVKIWINAYDGPFKWDWSKGLM